MAAAAPPDPHARRHLTWDGCLNVRDLGGLGRHTDGAFVRADSVEKLTAAGWAAAHAHGVRTVLDLRNDDEQGADAALRPEGITTVRLPLEDVADTAFWEPWFTDWRWGTPCTTGRSSATSPSASPPPPRPSPPPRRPASPSTAPPDATAPASSPCSSSPSPAPPPRRSPPTTPSARSG